MLRKPGFRVETGVWGGENRGNLGNRGLGWGKIGDIFGNRVLGGELVEILHKPEFRAGEGFLGGNRENVGNRHFGWEKVVEVWSYGPVERAAFGNGEPRHPCDVIE